MFTFHIEKLGLAVEMFANWKR